MKKFFFFAVAALALASCSNDETIEVNQGEAISFSPMVNNVTRAANAAGLKTSFEENDVINVHALYDGNQYFQSDFTKQSGTTGFTSTNKFYWPSDVTTKSVTFTAIWGITQTAGTAGNFTSYSPAAAAADQKDILVAKHTSSTKESPVPLNFRHALSQIFVKVKNTNPNLKVTITGVRIGYVKTASTSFTYSGGVTDTQELGSANNAANIAQSDWTLVDFATPGSGQTYANNYKYDQDMTSTSTVLTSTQSAMDFTGGFTPWILLPQDMKTWADADSDGLQDYANSKADGTATDAPDLSGSYIALEMAIENYDVANSTARGTIVAKQWCYWPITTNWNPGYKYTYTIDVAGGGYMPTDTDNDKELDPVLDGAVIIFSPDCTIDAWDSSDIDVSGGI